MCFSTLIYFSLTLFLSFCHTTRGDERRYECGAHGRFEYCIDGFPGCVVGCHCHPGYYFDTDSKICEPNVKLQQEFRRHYIAEPPHMQTPPNAPIALEPTPTPTPKTKTQLDEKVDEITKDADDIGDWLYNQFFKTIENQVINKTSDKPSKLTRRSGSSPPQRKNKRKSRKSSKDSKKKMGKVHGLRRKLLRITEDDSLFDSSSSAETSDETTSTSSESDSSDTTSESEGKKDDKEHGHSTILLFNKKPKPPLPSFIFLPHMGTPFYPPIGLPPPPVLPMYPMVPIPPMAPMFPYPASNKEEDNTNNGANAASSTLKPNEPPSNTNNTIAPDNAEAAGGGGGGGQGTDTGQPSSSANSTESIETPTNQRKIRNQNSPKGIDYYIRRDKKSRKGLSHPKEPNTKNMFRTKFNKGPRKKLMQKLRDNMRSKIPLINQFDNDQEEDSPLMNDLTSQEAYSLSQKIHLRAMEDGVPKMKDVDFKYLSELIHRANLNDTQKMSPHPIEPNENRRDMTYAGQVGRRSYQNEPAQKYTQQTNTFKEPRNLQTSGADNAFYSNLGRQIATMIRNIDSMGDRQVNIEIERTNPTITQTMFNENRYAPRSYWERSVRSPLHYFKEELEYLNTSNEKLFSLEKEVENAATTSPSLSLHDLEDILSTMSKAQVQIQRKVMFEEHKPDINKNNTRLNINLLPKHEIGNNENKMFYEVPSHNEYKGNTTKPKANEVNITVSSNTINRSKYSQLRVPADFWWLDMVKPIPVRQPEINKSINLNPIYEIKPTRRTLTDEISTTVDTIQSMPRRQHVDELKFIKALSRRQLQQTTTILPNLKYQTRILDYFNYFPSTRNDHKHDQRPIPYRRQISSFSRSINTPVQKPMRRPSYFHHELQHFDFFE